MFTTGISVGNFPTPKQDISKTRLYDGRFDSVCFTSSMCFDDDDTVVAEYD